MSASIPGKVVKTDDSDLTAPTVDLLKNLNLLGEANADPSSAGVAVLEANATNISKWVGGAVAALGGTATVLGAIGGFWKAQSDDVRIAAIAGLALVIPVTVFALVWVVNTDLRARTSGQEAVYQIRKAVALQMLDDSFQVYKMSQSALPAAAPRGDGTAPVSSTAAAPALTPIGEFIYRQAILGVPVPVVMRDGVAGTVTGYDEKDSVLRVCVLDGAKNRTWVSPDELTIKPTQNPGPPDSGDGKGADTPPPPGGG